MSNDCVFCKVINGDVAANIVFEDSLSVAFLDHRPLFPGHCLLVPEEHIETLGDLPKKLIAPLFSNVQLLSQAVEQALAAEGSFVAMNNRVSQSVPHLHVHIVPRRRKDGLKGFFWPRNKYTGDDHARETQAILRKAVARLRDRQGGTGELVANT